MKQYHCYLQVETETNKLKCMKQAKEKVGKKKIEGREGGKTQEEQFDINIFEYGSINAGQAFP